MCGQQFRTVDVFQRFASPNELRFAVLVDQNNRRPVIDELHRLREIVGADRVQRENVADIEDRQVDGFADDVDRHAQVAVEARRRGLGVGQLRRPYADLEPGGRVEKIDAGIDQQAALAGAGCVSPGLAKATYGTGVFVLAHAGERRPEPAGGLLPTVAWQVGGRLEWAIDGGVFTAGAVLDWLARDLGLADDAATLVAMAEGLDGAGGVRVLPALAGVGAPWWRSEARAVIAGLTAGAGPAEIAYAVLEGIAWRVADVIAAMRESVPIDVLRVDGGLTRSTALLRLQADAAAVSVQPGSIDATAAGAAALAAVGAGIWGSTAEISEHVLVGERVEPRGEEAWREREHAAWHEFVERAVEL